MRSGPRVRSVIVKRMRCRTNLLIPGYLALLVCLGTTGCTIPSILRTVGVDDDDTAQPAVSSEALALYSMGLRAEIQHDYDAAADAYLLALTKDPGRDALYQRLMAAYTSGRRHADARETFIKLAREHPQDPAVYRWLGFAHRLNDELEEAEKAYRKSIHMAPAKADAFVELSAMLFENQRDDEAIDILAEAAPAVARYEKVADVLGHYIVQKHEKDSALDPHLAERVAGILDDLSARITDEIEAGMRIAYYNVALERYGAAEEIYRSLSSKNPADSRIYLDWSALEIERGNPAAALSILEDAIPKAENRYELIDRLSAVHIHMAQQAETPEEARSHRADAIALLERNKATTPEDASLLLKLVILKTEQGYIADALDNLLSLEKITSARRELRIMLIDLVSETPSIGDEQKEGIERVLGAYSRLEEINILGGDLFSAMGDTERAIVYYRRAVEASEGTTADLYLRLALLEGMNDPGASLAVIREGLAVMPDNPRLLLGAAQSLAQQRDFPGAAAKFERAAEILLQRQAQLSTPFLLHYALTLQLSGRVDEAADLLSDDRLTELVFLQSYSALAHSRMEDEDRPTMEAVLEKLNERHPGNPWVVLNQGLFHYTGKNYEEAEQAFSMVEPMAMEKGLIPDDPDTPAMPAVFYFWHGAALERLERIEEADRQFRRSLEVDEDFPEAQNYLAYMWAERGKNLEEGLELINRALEAQPDNGAFVDTRGWIYFMMERYEDALSELKRAIELEVDAVIYDHLGDTYKKLSRMEDAVAAWIEALRLDPENEDYRDKLLASGEDVEALIDSFRSAEEENNNNSRDDVPGESDY